MNNIYNRLRLLEDEGAFTCTGDCRHCPYYHAISYTYRGCDVYYVLDRNGIELSAEESARLKELDEDYVKLSQRCDELRAASGRCRVKI